MDSGGPRRLLVLSLVLVSACAKDSARIEALDAPAGIYDGYDCAEIAEEAQRLSLVSRKLAAHVDGAAANDRGQTAVGLILFWPALFLLEGEETAFTEEYARVAGRFVALRAASSAKGCGPGLEGIDASAEPARS